MIQMKVIIEVDTDDDGLATRAVGFVLARGRGDWNEEHPEALVTESKFEDLVGVRSI